MFKSQSVIFCRAKGAIVIGVFLQPLQMIASTGSLILLVIFWANFFVIAQVVAEEEIEKALIKKAR